MNGHLFTYWPSRGRVECACGWQRKARSRALAMRQHPAHVLKKGMEPITALSKSPRTPFIAVYDGGTI